MGTNFIMYKGRMTPVSQVIKMKQEEATENKVNPADEELETLRESYKAKFGKYPSSNTKLETLKQKLQETSEA